MKNYKQAFVVLAVGVFIVPQVAFAAWWNPLSWSVWSIFNKTPQVSEVEKLRSEVEDLKKKISTPTVPSPQPSTSASDKSKTATKPIAPAVKAPVPASQLKKQDPQQFKTLVDENKTQLLEASKLLSNKNIIARVKPSVVYIETTTGSGSGVIVGADGYVLTNAHVVSGANSATVKLSNGGSFSGVVIGRDENIDLALLKINATGLSAAFLGDSDLVEQGDPVFTFGYPLGIEGDVAFKDGTLSRRQKIDGTTYLEISAQILPGNSGGPLVNQSGEVIGINTLAIGALKVSGVLIGETLKFAMPINVAKSLIPELKNGRNVVLPRQIVIAPVAPAPTPQPTPQPVTPQPQPAPITPPTPTPSAPTPKAPTPIPTVVVTPVPSTGGAVFTFKLSTGDYTVKSLTFSKAIVGGVKGDPIPTVKGMYLGYQLGTDCRSSNTVQSPINAAYDSLSQVTFVLPTPNTCKLFWVEGQTDFVPSSFSIQYDLTDGELKTLTDNLTVPAPKYSTTINYGTHTEPRLLILADTKIAKVGQPFITFANYFRNGVVVCDVPVTSSGPDSPTEVVNTGVVVSPENGSCILKMTYTPTTSGTQTLSFKALGLEKTLEIVVNP